MKDVVSTEELTKRYGQTKALDSLTLSLSSGVKGIVGPNGAGKTTLFQLLAHVIPPTKGSLTLFKETGSAGLHRLGYVPDRQALDGELRVQDYIRYWSGLSRARDEDMRHSLMVTRARDLLPRRIRELSKGQRQRVLVAQAIAHDPDLLILDEPFTNLDARTRRTLKEDIVERGNREKCILISAHSLSDLEDICGEIVVLNEGRKILHESISRLRERYRSSGQFEVSVEEVETFELLVKGLPGVASVVRTSKNSLHVRTTQEAAFRHELLTLLAEHDDVGFISVAVVLPNLEMILAELTDDHGES